MDLFRLLTLFSTQPQASGGAPPVSLPSGIIAHFGGSVAPTGWLLCDGSAVSRATYAALFAVIGTTFGAGDGLTTFNVPDMRGVVPVGTGTGSGLTNRVLAATGGEESHLLAIGEMPSHTHPMTNLTQGTAGGMAVSMSSISNNPASGPTGSTGGGATHNNMQPFLVVTAIISQ